MSPAEQQLEIIRKTLNLTEDASIIKEVENLRNNYHALRKDIGLRHEDEFIRMRFDRHIDMSDFIRIMEANHLGVLWSTSGEENGIFIKLHQPGVDRIDALMEEYRAEERP